MPVLPYPYLNACDTMKEQTYAPRDLTDEEIALQAIHDPAFRQSDFFKDWHRDARHRALLDECATYKEALLHLEGEVPSRRCCEVVGRTEQVHKHNRSKRWRPWIGAAAACLGLLAGGYFGWWQTIPPELIVYQAVNTDHRVTLSTDRGRWLIEEAGEANLENEVLPGEVSFVDGVLSYVTDEANAKTSAERVSAEETHQLATPPGETFALRLSDGTRVTLNGSTVLRYPTHFGRGERRVELVEGEAFFDVTADREHPFVVKMPQTQVRVLGTSFNVRSYTPEAWNVALATGSVEVKTEVMSTPLVLTPGECAYPVNGSQEVAKRPIDLEEVTAWTGLLFCFRDAPLEDILLAVGRWYNLSVVFKDESLCKLRFHLWAKKDEKAAHVIRMLNLTEKAKVELRGDVLTVDKP